MKRITEKHTFHNATSLTSTTANNGTAGNMTAGYEKLFLDIEITSTGSPDRMFLKVQTREDDDDTWKDYDLGYAKTMYFEDTQTSSGLNVGFPIPGEICEDQVRVVATAEGTVNGSNYWTVTVKGIRYSK